MEVSVITRHGSVPESIRQHAQRRIRRLERFERRVTAATLAFANDNGDHKVEARVAVAGGGQLVAGASAASYRSAIDQTLEKLERQLKRVHKRRQDRSARQAQTP